MMKHKILATVSALTLIAGSHAVLAADYPTPDKMTAKEKANFDAAFVDNDMNTEISIMNIDPHRTVNGMIEQHIFNMDGKDIGTIHDIIIDETGQAMLVIIKDSKLFGMGKIAAFDYRIITKYDDLGDMLISLNENSIKQAKEFSYKRSDESQMINVMPKNGYSVIQLLEGQLVNQKNKKVAEVDNLIFRNGKVNTLIVSFDTVLSYGGYRAALPFNDVKLIRDKSGYDFKLSSSQAAQFDNYKKIVK
jgi:sporulation protein YlmC with PRC-barrel domain